MNARHPVYTEKAECQDCYKCVRHCPVKAIEVRGGSATVMAELCIACGHCVEVCPAGAKRVRDDVPAARQLLAGGARVVVSLAPSWLAEFPGLEPARLVAVLKRLGFWGVSETAWGRRKSRPAWRPRPVFDKNRRGSRCGRRPRRRSRP